jgi:transposase
MKTLSLDLRERILAACDADDATRETVATRFRVSLGMVKKLLQQRRRLGDVAPLHHRAGRKPRILPAHREQLRRQLAAEQDRPDILQAASGGVAAKAASTRPDWSSSTSRWRKRN